MQVLSIIQYAAFLSIYSQLAQGLPLEDSEAANTAISKRAPGDTPGEAIDTWIDCTNIPDVCEADCMAILCHGAPQVMQRDSKNRRKNYAASGAAIVPFKGSAATMKTRGITVPNSYYDSAEETSYQGTSQGGDGCIIVPVPKAQQNKQGGLLQAMYRRNNVADQQWFKQMFTGTLGPYCTALMSNPPDTSICTKKLKQQTIDLKEYAFVREAGTIPIHFKNLFKGFSKRDGDDDEFYEPKQPVARREVEVDADDEDLRSLDPSEFYTSEELGI